MSEKLYKRFQAAMLGFTQKHGLEFERWNERLFCLKPVEGGHSAALQINFEPGFWALYAEVDEPQLPSLHRNLLRQIDGYNPALRLQFAQAFYLKTETIRSSRTGHSPEWRMPADYHRPAAAGGFGAQAKRTPGM